MRNRRIRSAAIIVLSLCISPAWAVKSVQVRHEQPKDFNSGELEQVVGSSQGEAWLARDQKVLEELQDKADVVNALARAGDGKIYAATGPEGVIYQINGDEVEEFARLPEGGTVFSLLFTKEGKLLAGTGGGEQARVYIIDGTGQAAVFYEPPDAVYVWAMARGSKGEIYMATGIEGQLHVVDPDGKNGKVLADLEVNNLLCLAIGPDHQLYVGTDENGLICRIDHDRGETFVLYDAKEPEISAVVLDPEGTLYASTADADAAKPGHQIVDKPGGRPEAAEASPDVQPTTQPADESSSDGMPVSTQPANEPQTTQRVGRTIEAKEPSKDGNAVYRIDQDGFVTEVFREPVMVLDMAEKDGTLYLATGNEGRIYQVTPRREQSVMLSKLEPSQATCLLRLPDGRMVIGTANGCILVRMADRYAEKGTLTSEPQDAKQVVKWGRITWQADIPEGTRLTLATRSGNVEDPESSAWQPWSEEMDVTTPRQIPTINARFLQYRLSFSTTVPDQSPVVKAVEWTYIEENRPPDITDLSVLPGSKVVKQPGVPSSVKAKVSQGGVDGVPPPDHHWVALWKVEDPNNDTLEFSVYYRQIGHQRWIRMAKELDDPYMIWDTRTVPDGRYELRVKASDQPDNPKGTQLTFVRISDPVEVDNTPPEVAFDDPQPTGGDSFRIHARLTDNMSTIIGAEYAVDSMDKWLPLGADDDIFDSTAEGVTFAIDELETGEHRIALRVRDEQGNLTYASIAVAIQP